MLKPISRLRSRCKGDLNTNYLYLEIIRYRKKILQLIPVLSIFALLGIIGFSTIGLPLAEPDGEVYAAETVNTNTSLIIDNGTATDSTTTVRSGVTYSSHTVQVKADNITKYSLTITGPANLTNGTTTISGAGGKTGTQLASADTGWGYGWNTTTTDNASMTYNSFTGSAQTLSGDSVSSNAINFTRKLVFAAKFDSNATEGHYKANVTLKLTVTPRTVINWSVNYNTNGGSGGPSSTSGTADGTSYTYTIPTTSTPTTSQSGYKFDGYSTDGSTSVSYWPGDTITLRSTSPSITLYAVYKLSAFPSSLSTMQGMTASICDSVATGVSKALTDSGRGNTSYTVRKLRDGNCWMVDNLKLNIRSYTLSSSNTDLASGVSFSSSSATLSNNTSTWSNANDSAIVYSSSPSVAVYGASYDSSYGYYYSWCAATAGTCSGATTSGAEASSSICPKGWKLPDGDYFNGDFAILDDKYKPASGWSTENSIKGKWLGAASADAGGAFFPAAGYIYNEGLYYTGSGGEYWTRTAASSTSAYVNSITSGSSSITSERSFQGIPIRCIAYSS